MKKALSRINNIGEYKLSFILYIFCLIFAPPIIPKINVGLITAVISFFILIFKYKFSIIKVLKTSGILKFSAFFVLFLMYLVLITALNCLFLGEKVQLMHYITLWYRYFLIVPVLMIACLYICVQAKELGYSPKQLCYCFVFATLIQFGLVIISLIFSEVKDFFIKTIYQNTGDEYLMVPWITDRRGFGFSNTFVDSFGWGMGIIAALPLFLIEKKNFKPILLIPFLLTVSLVNARTGFIMLLISLPFGFFILLKDLKNTTLKTKLKALGIVTLSAFLLAVLCVIILIFSPLTLRWVGSGIASFLPDTNMGAPDILNNTINELKNDATTTTSEVLFSDRFWNLPKGYILLFGSGHSIFGANGYKNSDVGYVNDMWIGGIIGSAILYLAFFCVFKQAFKSANGFKVKALVLFFAICFLTFQIKANAITFSAGLNTTLPIIFYIIYCKNSAKPKSISTTQTDKISLIVPVYNVENYLERCVKSILNQSYKNIEVVLVDDGSTDKSGAICDRLKSTDSRVKVYHTKNGGLSAARNFGIEKASGNYIAFVDSDDFIKPDFLLYLITAIKQNACGIAACGYEMYYSPLLSFSVVSDKSCVYAKSEAIKGIFKGEKTVDVMAWNKLYSAKLFKDGIRFPKGILHEDVATTYKLLYKAERIAYAAQPLYCYFQRKGSIVGSGAFNPKRLSLIKTVEEIKPVIEDFDFDCTKEYQFYVFLNNLHLLNSMLLGNFKNKKLVDNLKNQILNDYKRLKEKHHMGLSFKISCYILSINLNLYKLLRRCFNRFKFIRGVFL